MSQFWQIVLLIKEYLFVFDLKLWTLDQSLRKVCSKKRRVYIDLWHPLTISMHFRCFLDLMASWWQTQLKKRLKGRHAWCSFHSIMEWVRDRFQVSVGLPVQEYLGLPAFVSIGSTTYNKPTKNTSYLTTPTTSTSSKPTEVSFSLITFQYIRPKRKADRSTDAMLLGQGNDHAEAQEIRLPPRFLP